MKFVGVDCDLYNKVITILHWFIIVITIPTAFVQHVIHIIPRSQVVKTENSCAKFYNNIGLSKGIIYRDQSFPKKVPYEGYPEIGSYDDENDVSFQLFSHLDGSSSETSIFFIIT